MELSEVVGLAESENKNTEFPVIFQISSKQTSFSIICYMQYLGHTSVKTSICYLSEIKF